MDAERKRSHLRLQFYAADALKWLSILGKAADAAGAFVADIVIPATHDLSAAETPAQVLHRLHAALTEIARRAMPAAVFAELVAAPHGADMSTILIAHGIARDALDVYCELPDTRSLAVRAQGQIAYYAFPNLHRGPGETEWLPCSQLSFLLDFWGTDDPLAILRVHSAPRLCTYYSDEHIVRIVGLGRHAILAARNCALSRPYIRNVRTALDPIVKVMRSRGLEAPAPNTAFGDVTQLVSCDDLPPDEAARTLRSLGANPRDPLEASVVLGVPF